MYTIASWIRQALSTRKPSLNVVIQEELVRMGSEPEGVHFLCPLVVDPHLDGVLGENVSLQQEVVVRLEVALRLFQRARLANSSVTIY